ncbi:vegetative incompatibility protein HET-E-1 [Podospora aff. communis PSN243]|uniref:Vegetative incompatibility protein HET-E-1 n=1 Tax=Podospora aff. communis PSN243 TaxID=3040156 RepID=A0AAV9H2L4_9PEZI|nr:vegetative incompatibility protein HET-E-1 [Podospora aff. communis PSN243]
MRLLSTSNIPNFVEFIGEEERPPYAILSHTWEKGHEVSLRDLSDPARHANKNGYRKIEQACAVAARNGFQYTWVDTCCINKDSSAELGEAINSMFRWYQEAAVCYVFLADLEPEPAGSEPVSEIDFTASFSNCAWFTRGWTLQELIAPRDVLFFDRDWNFRGSKWDLCELISSITGIPQELLLQKAELSEFAVARKMSWAAGRKTTRLEDEAYCLLGILGVHMALLYGEGRAAFSRLQEAVFRATGDLSILAWADDEQSGREYSGFFADSPSQFHDCSQIHSSREDIGIYRDPIFTTRGIRMDASLVHLYRGRHHHQPVLRLHCTVGDVKFGVEVGVYLRKIGGGRYARWNSGCTIQFTAPGIGKRRQSAPTRYGTSMPVQPQRLFKGTALPVETLILPRKLEPKFPLHPTNPVLGNRNTALQMVFDVGDSGLELFGLLPMPRSHWDRHDQVFFCTNRVNKSWCAAFVEWRLGSDVFLLFVACFYWNKHDRETVALVAVLNGIDDRGVLSLKHGLNHVKFEDTREAEDLISGELGAERLCYGPTHDVDLGWTTVSVTRQLRQDLRPDICLKPMNFLDISISTTLRA